MVADAVAVVIVVAFCGVASICLQDDVIPQALEPIIFGGNGF